MHADQTVRIATNAAGTVAESRVARTTEEAAPSGRPTRPAVARAAAVVMAERSSASMATQEMRRRGQESVTILMAKAATVRSLSSGPAARGADACCQCSVRVDTSAPQFW
jgi:hypothetical protein